MKLTSIPKTWKHLRRYRQILGILVKYGFSDVVDVISNDLITRFGEKFVPRLRTTLTKTASRAERLRLVFEELGPTFIKAGQTLSMRPDLLPPEYIAELQKLQDRVNPIPFEQILASIESEGNGKLAGCLSRIEEKPIASASIAQVHKATLKTGDEVVLKVQRPGIRRQVEIDIEVLSDIARVAKKYLKDQISVDPVEVVKEFDKVIHRELNFLREGRTIERFREFFSGDRTVYVPRYYHWLSSDKILVMEYVGGIKASDKERLLEKGFDPEIIAKRGVRLSFRQIFELGLFHADPHGGNILVIGDNVIVPLDFGIVGYVDAEMIDFIADMLKGFVKNDPKIIIRAMERMDMISSSTDVPALKAEIGELISNFSGSRLDTYSIEDIASEIFNLAYSFKLKVSTRLSLMSRALVTAEGLARMLYPELKVLDEIKPFVTEIIKRRYNPFVKLKKGFTNIDDLALLMEDFPGKMRSILSKASSGQFSIQFEHRNLENLISELNRSSNRLASALVIAALIIGSSLVIQLPVGPKVLGYPLIGMAGYVLAFIIGIKLLWDIFRSKK